MAHKKNTAAQIVATIALLSIILWVIGTGMLVIFGGNGYSAPEYSEEQIQELLESYSWTTTVTASWGEDVINIPTE